MRPCVRELLTDCRAKKAWGGRSPTSLAMRGRLVDRIGSRLVGKDALSWWANFGLIEVRPSVFGRTPGKPVTLIDRVRHVAL